MLWEILFKNVEVDENMRTDNNFTRDVSYLTVWDILSKKILCCCLLQIHIYLGVIFDIEPGINWKGAYNQCLLTI